jgi:hypothetical protein
MLNSAISNGKKRWSDQNYYIVKALSAIYLKSNPNPDFTEKDYKMKCEIFDIPNDNTCFISGKLSKGIGDHIYEINGYFKYTKKRGINDKWNLIPVAGEYNKNYKIFKFNMNGINVKKNIGYETLTDNELIFLVSSINHKYIEMADIYVKLHAWKMYVKKRGAKLFFKETSDMVIIRERFIENYNKIWEQFQIDCKLITN